MTEGALQKEKERLLAEIAARRAELALKTELCAELFDRAEDGIAITSPDGTTRLNPAAEAILKTPSVEAESGDQSWKNTWSFRRLDNGQQLSADELAGFRIMTSNIARASEELEIQNPGFAEPIFTAQEAVRLEDGGAIVVMRDIAVRVKGERELAARNARLAEQDAEHRMLIERLRVALGELATPVLQVAKGVLVLPIIGVLDTERSLQISERLLSEVVRTRASRVIIDVTGVEVMDTSTADRFGKLARGVELLGARCYLSGVQPSVAQTLVALDVKLDALSPHRNLAHALASADDPRNRKARKEVAR
jgi:rsbT co-antagonist protein RsbR